MAWTSWRTPGTISSQTRTGGSVAWTNPSNAGASDNSYATAFLNGNSSHWLWCTNFGFTNSDIPDGATVTGIRVRYERKQSNALDGGIATAYFKVIIGGAEAGTQKTQNGTWPIADETSSEVGGTGDVWSTSITQANAIASDTGIALAGEDIGFSGSTGSVDVLELSYEYTVASTRRRVYSSMM